MAVFGEQGALDLQLLSGKQCVGASAGRGPTAGLGSGVTVAPRLYKGRQAFQSTGASVCCECISVWVCDVLYNAQACASDVFVYVCAHMHICGWVTYKGACPGVRAQLAAWGHRASLDTCQGGSKLGVQGHPWVVFQAGAGHVGWAGCVGLA